MTTKVEISSEHEKRATREELLECVTTGNVEKFKAVSAEAKENFLRELLLEEAARGNAASTSASLLDFVVRCAREGACAQCIPFVLIGDLFDVSTLDSCLETFTYLETRLDVWKSDLFYAIAKNHLLKTCNSLLKRVSSLRSTEFSGKIHLFMARFFSIEEKSGQNMTGEFNVDNSTAYNADALDRNEERHEDDGDDGDMDDDDRKKQRFDANLYKKFWSLQDYFRNPILCYNKDRWITFVSNSDEVLTSFESSSAVQSLPKSTDEHFCAKYLTSEKLFHSQLEDVTFRKHVLLQFLIAFHYLKAEVKFKSSTQVIDEEQKTWLEKTTKRINKILGKTGSDGKKFVRTIEFIMKRDKNWNNWKNQNCPPIIRNEQKSAELNDPEFKRKRKRSLDVDLRTDSKVRRLGNRSMDILWNLKAVRTHDENLTKLYRPPTFDEYFSEAIEQLDPESGIEDQYKLTNEPTFAWKALRALRTHRRFCAPVERNEVAPKVIRQFLEKVLGEHVGKKKAKVVGDEAIDVEAGLESI